MFRYLYVYILAGRTGGRTAMRNRVSYTPQRCFNLTGMASLPPLKNEIAMPVSLFPALWMKQLAIRLSCKKPQPSRWLSRKRARETVSRYASFTLIANLYSVAQCRRTFRRNANLPHRRIAGNLFMLVAFLQHFPVGGNGFLHLDYNRHLFSVL